jgi:short-subunit dehydrogenase
VSFDESRKRLRGQTAIITGASSGVGRATALAFVAEGMRVVLTARREGLLEALEREIVDLGGDAVIFAGDAGDEATAIAVRDLALKRFGSIDVLVNNAGQGNYKKLVDTSVAEYDELMNSNMRSSFLFSRMVVPRMIEQRSGSIVFVSSVAGLAGAANEAVYSASKFAQVGFAQSLAEELRGWGIKVCAVCPGGVKTEFAVGRGRTAEGVAHSPMMNASDVADAIVFACQQPPSARVVQLTVRHMGEPYA